MFDKRNSKYLTFYHSKCFRFLVIVLNEILFTGLLVFEPKYKILYNFRYYLKEIIGETSSKTYQDDLRAVY